MTNTDVIETVDPCEESRVRSMARRKGFIVRKSRQRNFVPNIDNHSNFMLIDAYNNLVVLGSRFDATLGDIRSFCRECAAGKSNHHARGTTGG